MKMRKVAFGERYGDDSGWEKLLEVDTHEDRVRVDVSGSHASMTTEEAWWLLRALMEAREALGMDKIVLSRPSPDTAPGKQP